MPPGETEGTGKEAPPPRSGGGEGGRLGDLPDHLLEHILGFLPAQLAVRTCVLSRRWRHLWKTATGVRITDVRDGGDGLVPEEELGYFVQHLLLLRGGAPIHSFELRLAGMPDGDGHHVNLWLRHAVQCQARALRLHVSELHLELGDPPLVSRHLARLELNGVDMIHENFLDFSSCPVLEHLEIVNCEFLSVKKISSKSLKRLIISDCYFSQISRTLICVPNLVLLSMRIEDYWNRTPVFEAMPLLVEASIKATIFSRGVYWDSSYTCLLLQTLSHAKSLELSFDSTFQSPEFAGRFFCTVDSIRCPTFSNLKTLLLAERQCLSFDLHTLNCILRCTPSLERLTLELFSVESERKLEMKGSYSQRQWSSEISEHLKIVIVKCGAIDERVTEVLKHLSTLNIRFEFEQGF